MKKGIVIVIVLVLIGLGAGAFFLLRDPSNNAEVQVPQDIKTTGTTPAQNEQPAAETPAKEPENKTETVIGRSVEGRNITAYHYGAGSKEILFVGGIHGGYEWNTVLVAYELMDYLKANPNVIPANIKITVVPVLNPDGLNKVVTVIAGRFAASDVSSSQELRISGRYNANKVDLNRNFDCEWKSSGTWQKTAVSGGSKVFSEPESQAIKNYVETHSLSAAVVWYSAADGVYASNCQNGVLPETRAIMNLYSKASGYPAYEKYDYYELTGDMVNWFAEKNIPGISILLATHEDTEWNKNLAGIKAVLEHYK